MGGETMEFEDLLQYSDELGKWIVVKRVGPKAVNWIRKNPRETVVGMAACALVCTDPVGECNLGVPVTTYSPPPVVQTIAMTTTITSPPSAITIWR
jgi:hypothetical protein